MLDASTQRPAYRDSSLGGIEIPQELLTSTEASDFSVPDIDEEQNFEGETGGGQQESSGQTQGGENNQGRAGGNDQTSPQAESNSPVPDLPEEGNGEAESEETQEMGEGQNGLEEMGGTGEGELPGLMEEGNGG